MALIELILELIAITTFAIYCVWRYFSPNIQEKRHFFVIAAAALGIAAYFLSETYLRSIEKHEYQLSAGTYGAQRAFILCLIMYAGYRIVLFLPQKFRKIGATLCILIVMFQAYVQITHIYNVLFPVPVNCPDGVIGSHVVSFWHLFFEKPPRC